MLMAQEINIDSKRLLKRAQYLLEEGRREQALSLLESIETDDKEGQYERAYLLGWCYTLLRRWDEALSTLAPIPTLADWAEVEAESVSSIKLVHCLLRLGEVAVNRARYENASKHYIRCLKVLHTKKLDMPLEHAKAHYGLATTQCMRGLYPASEQSYHEAAKYLERVTDNEEHGHLHYGLAYLYRISGKLVEARLEAREALHYYKESFSERREHYVGQTYNLLGVIAFLLGDYREASDYYGLALAIAPQYSGLRMCMLNCIGLAEVRVAERRFEEADEFCQQALKYAQTVQAAEKDEQLVGSVYLMFGKVAQRKAEGAEPQEKECHLHEAIRRFEQARDKLRPTQSYADVAELYGRWAQVLEDLGQPQEAVKYWKYGYEALSVAKGPSLY
jgi:tetratricopeptide (TPR) repeat protein